METQLEIVGTHEYKSLVEESSICPIPADGKIIVRKSVNDLSPNLTRMLHSLKLGDV
jgi:hypothetical protein